MTESTFDLLGVQRDAWRERHHRVYLLIEDTLLTPHTDAELRVSPTPELASVAWHLWHSARCEDLAVNALIARQPQVLDDADWFASLNVGRRDIGTGMTPAEVADFNARIDLTVLRGYLRAVHERSTAVVDALAPEDWAQVIDEATVDRELREHVLDAGTRQWVGSFWKGTTTTWLLWWLAGGHQYLHYGEALVTRDVLAARHGR